MQNCALNFQVAAGCARPRGRVGGREALHASCSLRLQGSRPFQQAGPLLRLSSDKHTSSRAVVAQAAEGDGEKSVKYNTEFGYSRKDVILIGVGITGLGVGMYYGLQATGMEPGMAGNFVQLIVVLGLSLGWVGSYLFRVANKQMTYVKQLEDYEEAVMAKRLAEMPEAEVERMLEEVEAEKQRKAARRAGGAGGGQQ